MSFTELLTPDLIDSLMEYITIPWKDKDIEKIREAIEDQTPGIIEDEYEFFHNGQNADIYFILSITGGCPKKCREILEIRRRELCPNFDEIVAAAAEGKHSKAWKQSEIPRLFAGIDVFEDYMNNPRRNDDFEKYYKTYGLRLVSPKWNAKFADLKPVHRAIKNAIVPAYIFDIFIEIFRKVTYQHSRDICWPFMSNIVSSTKVRNDPEYPLCTPADIIKLHHICSYFFDYRTRDNFLRDFVASFLRYSRKDVWEWRDKIAVENPEYAKLLIEEDRKKKSDF